MNKSPIHVEILDLRDRSVFDDVHALQVKAFGSFDATLLKSIMLDGRPETVLFGVYSPEDGSLVGVNGFVAHSVHRDGVTGIAYQSCISATNPDFKGKGTFSAIINHAKAALAEAGGAFIFGYPNSKSGPIFTGKLGFTLAEVGLVYVAGVGDWPVPGYGINTDVLAKEAELRKCVQFDARETALWKSQFAAKPKVVELDMFTNYAFGRVVERRVGPLKIRMLSVGGYEINKPEIFPKLLLRLREKAGANVVRVVTPGHTPLFLAAHKHRLTDTSEPLIVFPLNWQVSASDVDACTGLKDVF
ncbi:hypothetical protein [Hydrogenophaga sp. RWCD_12]|uniref:hypothetical protein n=1 Tax=Hydrogenophaga sp. RWCD_12 TaxID=3391190 RepID=UPI0039849F28